MFVQKNNGASEIIEVQKSFQKAVFPKYLSTWRLDMQRLTVPIN